MREDVKLELLTSNTGEDPRVYLVKNQRKYWVINEEVLVGLGFTWNQVKKVSPNILENIPTYEPITSVNQRVYDTADFIYCVEKTWSDDGAIGIMGWVVGKKTYLKNLSIAVDGHLKTVTNWIEKPEIFNYFSTNTSFAAKKKCGFMATIHRNNIHELKFFPNNTTTRTFKYPTQPNPSIYPQFPINKKLEQQFRDLVNNNNLSVLEVGSRISPGGINKRDFYKQAKEYVGFDYLDGETVDVVGDAHELSKYFKTKRFNAIYSDSVLEHLAMPWKAVIEMNAVLKKGGYVLHSAPASWTPHDMPWDFWRFSDASMKVLFSKPFGFRVIDVEFNAPAVSLHIEGGGSDRETMLPVSPAFGFVSILAQKIDDINPRKIRFNADLQSVVGKSSYPEWAEVS